MYHAASGSLGSLGSLGDRGGPGAAPCPTLGERPRATANVGGPAPRLPGALC